MLVNNECSSRYNREEVIFCCQSGIRERKFYMAMVHHAVSVRPTPLQLSVSHLLYLLSYSFFHIPRVVLSFMSLELCLQTYIYLKHWIVAIQKTLLPLPPINTAICRSQLFSTIDESQRAVEARGGREEVTKQNSIFHALGICTPKHLPCGSKAHGTFHDCQIVVIGEH